MSDSPANKNRSATSKRGQSDPPPPEPTGLKRLIRVMGGPTVLSILWPAMLLIVGYVAWQQWGNQYVGQKFYGIELQRISVSNAPDYVRSDVIADVYESAALDEMSILDAQACAKIASAFASHPWVSRVVGVRKLAGGRVDVRLEYRKPVAMVHVVHRGQSGSTNNPLQAGFFAVDGTGVLLPPSDFAPVDTDDFLHIVVPGAYPTGGIGTPFGDARVEAAALLAHLLHEHRQTLGLSSIGVHGDLRANPVVQLEIAGHVKAEHSSADRWFWGSPPGREAQGEVPAMMKLRALLEGAPAGSDLRQLRYTSVASGTVDPRSQR